MAAKMSDKNPHGIYFNIFDIWKRLYFKTVWVWRRDDSGLFRVRGRGHLEREPGQRGHRPAEVSRNFQNRPIRINSIRALNDEILNFWKVLIPNDDSYRKGWSLNSQGFYQ